MTNTAAQTFRDSLKKILTEYPTPDNIGEGTDFETAHSDHSLYQLVVDQTGNAITELIDTEKYSIKASVGRGSPTFIPYIAVMNKSETTSPQNGRYVVYLFDPIERDLYLTFNQGATEAKEIASDSDLIPAEILRSRAERMAQDIDLQDFTNDRIKFSPQGEKAELYGAGTICYKKYAPENFPEADIILDDLKRLLDEYDQIITSPVPKVINQDTKTTSDTLQDLLDRYLPPDWDDSPSRREQILAVTQYFVEETDPEDSTSARRKEAQKKVAEDKGVRVNTIQSKCGRETWKDHVSQSDAYQRDHFDSALEQVEDVWSSNKNNQIDSNNKKETQSEYWELVSAKESAGEMFMEAPTKDNLAIFLEEFWTLRASPSIEWILSDESDWISDTPTEVADTLRKAIDQNDISIATRINGFGVSVASEALRALEPTKFPILNEPAYRGMIALGYSPSEPSNASPEDYTEFVVDVEDAIERYNLLQIAKKADGVFAPKWATELQIADHLFYMHTDEDSEFTFNEGLPCSSNIESAPYYWVNQSPPTDDQGQLKTVPDGSFETDIGRLEADDTVFHYDGEKIVGYSTVDQDPQAIKINDGLGCKADVSFSSFEEPVSFSDVFEYLLHEMDEEDEYFPVNESGLKSGYLFNLSEPAGNYILQQAKPDSPGGSQVHRLEERISRPNFSVSLPTGLYFHEREASRLKQQINAALNSGKHIIFTGPPGTGKSKLAKSIAEQAADRHNQIDGHVFTTATAEWTTFDTIGGYVPDESGDSLEFDPRLFLRCFRDDEDVIQNKWLVVDELNRANIDKALGPLFSVLAQDSVQLPFEREHRIQIDWIEDHPNDEEGMLSEIANDPDRFPVTPSWWLIGTMNTVDKTSLYDLSFAFMRRFSFIHVGVPKLTIESDGEEIASRTLLDPESDGQNYATTWQQGEANLRDTIDNYHEDLSIIWPIVNRYRTIGPAIILDLIQYLDAHEGGDEDTPLTSAVISLVLPQIEGLREQHQLDLLDDLEKGLPIQDEEGETGGREVDLPIDFDYLRRKAYDMFDLDPEK